MNINEKILEEIIKKVIQEQMKNNEETFQKYVDDSGVISIKADTVECKRFDTGKEEDQVYLTDVLSLQESPRLGCGMMEMKETTFDWTLQYDEVDYIIEGSLEIIIDGRKVVGNKGDILFIPKGSSIQFSAPNHARFMYVTYPANWEEIAKSK
ncbi:cupin domain-containing protein [Inediibacterium massiliense]|uniref:cupin domain-containing protein n=1 Tax=Inediibacterium massiliense TaxID=1658111 RepID=UPI0006B647B5|nr:cupin domain-containing protein [Inediibacterium massiliense]